MAENVTVSDTVNIRIFLYDGTTKITGESPVLFITRISDGKFWTGAVWQSGSASVTMTAVTPTGNDHTDGVYEYDFTTGASAESYDWSVTHTLGVRDLVHRGRIKAWLA